MNYCCNLDNFELQKNQFNLQDVFLFNPWIIATNSAQKKTLEHASSGK